MNGELLAAREAAEKSIGFQIPDKVAEDVLEYARRKCEVTNQDDDYLPLLYATELRDAYTRAIINLKGDLNHVLCMRSLAL